MAQPEIVPAQLTQNDVPRLLRQLRAVEAVERLEGARGLLQLQRQNQFPAELRQDAGPLIAALGDEVAEVRLGAVKLLGGSRDDRALEPLLNMLAVEDAEMRRETLAALISILKNREEKPPAKSIAALCALLRDADPQLRSGAANVLGLLGDKRAIEPLLACLDDKDIRVCGAAALALGKLHAGEALERIIALLHDPEWLARNMAVTALRELADPRSEEALIAALEDENEMVASNAAVTLGKFGDKRVIEMLIAIVNNRKGFRRYGAVQALGEINDPRAVEPLIGALEVDEFFIRENAARALGNLRDPRAALPLLRMMGKLDDANEDEQQVIFGAMTALRQIGKAAHEAIITALGQKDDPALRLGAARAAQQCPDTRQTPALIELLESTDPRCRDAVARALARRDWDAADAVGPLLENIDEPLLLSWFNTQWWLSDPEAVPALLERLDDPDPKMRYTAAEALGNSGDERAIDALLAMMDDPSEEVVQRAMFALAGCWGCRRIEPILEKYRTGPEPWRVYLGMICGAMRDARAVEPIATLLQNDPQPMARQTAVMALDLIGDARGIPALAAALDDADRTLSLLAAYSLLHLGDDRGMEDILAALREGERPARMAVLEYLLPPEMVRVSWGATMQPRTGMQELDPRLVEALLALLKDNDPGNVRDAAKVLGKLREPRAVEPLIACLQAERNRDIHAEVAEALADIGGPRAVEALLPLLGSVQLREHAVRLLQTAEDPRAIAPLVALLAEKAPLPPHENERLPLLKVQAARALAAQGDARGVEYLLAALRDRERKAGYMSLVALTDCEDARVTPAALEKVEDADPVARLLAARILLHRQNERAVPLLLAGLAATGGDSERGLAALILAEGKLSVEEMPALAETVDPLLAMTAAQSNRLRFPAIVALGVIGDRRAVEPLLAGLPRDIPLMQECAIRSLAALDDRRIVPQLIELLETQPANRPRVAAARALVNLTGQDFGDNMGKWREWWEEQPK